MESKGEARCAYEVAMATVEKMCDENNVIMKITEGFPFVVSFTVDAPLTLLEAQSGELVAPKIIVTVGIDSTVKSRADKAISTAILKKLIKNAEGLADLFFRQTAEAVYQKVYIEMKTPPIKGKQLEEIADRMREEADKRSGVYA